MTALKELGMGKLLKFFILTFWGFIFSFALFPPIRTLMLVLFGAKIGRGTIIHSVKFFNLHHTGLKGFILGKNCFLGDETLIDLYNKVVCQDWVTFAPRVLVITHTNVGYKDHPLQRFFPKMSKPVTFKRGCFIGAGAIILPGVTIGKEAFVAAGAVVTKDVADRSLVAGVPAKEIRKIK